AKSQVFLPVTIDSASVSKGQNKRLTKLVAGRLHIKIYLVTVPHRHAKRLSWKISAKHLLGERHAKMQIFAETSSFTAMRGALIVLT
ncbi:MAG TPA: hypothetical protein VN284_11395, partial [Rhizobium sp.]|nr:hypothetical protein [Rhizobium sp.]